MKLIGVLREKVEAADSGAEARAIIANAGMLLTDDELEVVTGGLQTRSPDNVPYDFSELFSSPEIITKFKSREINLKEDIDIK